MQGTELSYAGDDVDAAAAAAAAAAALPPSQSPLHPSPHSGLSIVCVTTADAPSHAPG